MTFGLVFDPVFWVVLPGWVPRNRLQDTNHPILEGSRLFKTKFYLLMYINLTTCINIFYKVTSSNMTFHNDSHHPVDNVSEGGILFLWMVSKVYDDSFKVL